MSIIRYLENKYLAMKKVLQSESDMFYEIIGLSPKRIKVT